MSSKVVDWKGTYPPGTFNDATFLFSVAMFEHNPGPDDCKDIAARTGVICSFNALGCLAMTTADELPPSCS
jgi:hypothetical protein